MIKSIIHQYWFYRSVNIDILQFLSILIFHTIHQYHLFLISANIDRQYWRMLYCVDIWEYRVLSILILVDFCYYWRWYQRWYWWKCIVYLYYMVFSWLFHCKTVMVTTHGMMCWKNLIVSLILLVSYYIIEGLHTNHCKYNQN